MSSTDAPDLFTDAPAALSGPNARLSRWQPAGATVRVAVYNYDDMPHTFTATELGVNAKVPAGSEEKPSKVTFTFQAPQEAGSYEWFCALPCDPWSMTHYGYMKGYVKVV